ncbi:hypothetical protein TNCV_563651 [Trichonephila clavipes]|nr:hypothetical protein TNCV_563651 [Trichonephila clavipes]
MSQVVSPLQTTLIPTALFWSVTSHFLWLGDVPVEPPLWDGERVQRKKVNTCSSYDVQDENYYSQNNDSTRNILRFLEALGIYTKVNPGPYTNVGFSYDP